VTTREREVEDAISDIASAVLKAAMTALTRHQTGSNEKKILAVGIAIAVHQLDEILLPGIRSMIATFCELELRGGETKIGPKRRRATSRATPRRAAQKPANTN
jgi:hypothetical protein